MDHHKNIQGGGATFREKDPCLRTRTFTYRSWKKDLGKHDACFSVVDEKNFILKKPAAATHPTSRAKLTEEFLYFDD